MSEGTAEQKETKSLWIDQICINQNNSDEKSVQVSIMGAIYRSAAQVTIWLGPGTPDSGQALSFIIDLWEALSAHYELHNGGVDPFREDYGAVRLEPTGFEVPVQIDPRWTALFGVLDRKWFSRCWIVQEVMANDNVIVHCGNDQLDWSYPRALNLVLDHYSALLTRLMVNCRRPTGLDFLWL